MIENNHFTEQVETTFISENHFTESADNQLLPNRPVHLEGFLDSTEPHKKNHYTGLVVAPS
jgi:hypothetical protein